MAVLVRVVPDKFKRLLGRKAELARELKDDHSSARVKSIRRPTTGITIKEPTYADLSVVTGNGSNIVLIDAGSRVNEKTDRGELGNSSYSNFLLQSVNYADEEKSQILETFGEAYIYFFGRRPRFYQFSGILMNTYDFNWQAEWEANYDRYLRGTRCVESDAQVFLSFDETIVSGYILSFQSSKSSDQPHIASLSFNMFVTSVVNVSALGDPSVVPPYKRVDLGVGPESNPLQLPANTQAGEGRSGKVGLDGIVSEPSFLDKAHQGFFGSLTENNLSIVGSFTSIKKKAGQFVDSWLSGALGSFAKVPPTPKGAIAYSRNYPLRLEENGRLMMQRKFSDNGLEYINGLATYDENPNDIPGVSGPSNSSDPKRDVLGQIIGNGYSPPPGKSTRDIWKVLSKVNDAFTGNVSAVKALGSSTLWRTKYEDLRLSANTVWGVVSGDPGTWESTDLSRVVPTALGTASRYNVSADAAGG